MKVYLSLAAVLLCLWVESAASQPEEVISRNAAFYEGETLNYVIAPPPRFRLVDREAIDDGYSFAFVPESSQYGGADIMIGVNIYKIRGLSFADVVAHDTASLRAHYGDSLVMWEVDSVIIGSGDPIKTFFLDDKGRFIPNVMVSYFDGGGDLLIFELVISDSVLRPHAEEAFIACLRSARALVRGQTGLP